MSRGGGAGRGRRGGFGAPKTGVNSIEVPDSLIVSYEEMPLFPYYEVKPFKKPCSDELILFEIKSNLKKKFKSEIERYADKFLNAPRQKALFSEEISKLKINMFPDELHSVITNSKRKKTSHINVKDMDLSKLDELEKQESNGAGASFSAKAPGNESDQEDAQDEISDQDEDEDDNDYGVDYYDDDHDAFGDDGDADGRDDY